MPPGLPMTSSKKGAYIDSWAQYSWFKNSVKGDELAYESYSAKGATVSLEAGYGFALNKSFGLEAAKYTWIFQPQAQAIWMASIIMRTRKPGNDSNLLIVFYVQIMPDDFVMQLHRF